MRAEVDSKVFQEFLFKIAMAMKMPKTSKDILARFVDIDIKAEDVAKSIRSNQYVENSVMTHIKSLLKDKNPDLEAAGVLLGMVGTRDFVCALQLIRTVSQEFPALGPDGKFQFKPMDVLKYAKKTEEYVSARHMPYADMAYAAGMMFDRMVAIGTEIYKAPKSYYDSVEEVYKHGLKSARVGFEIANSVKSIGFSKVIFAACLIHDVGKLAMELLYPEGSPNAYKNFNADINKKPLNRHMIYFLECQRYGFTHDYYGAQLVWSFEVFRNIERALLYHHQPYLTKSAKDIYNLASLIALSSNIARKYQPAKTSNDPVIHQWLTPELNDFRIAPSVLVGVMEKCSKESF